MKIEFGKINEQLRAEKENAKDKRIEELERRALQ